MKPFRATVPAMTPMATGGRMLAADGDSCPLKKPEWSFWMDSCAKEMIMMTLKTRIPRGSRRRRPTGKRRSRPLRRHCTRRFVGPDDRRAEQVERVVDEGCDEGEGAAPHRRDPLREQEDNVGDDVDVDGLFLTIFGSTSSDQE